MLLDKNESNDNLLYWWKAFATGVSFKPSNDASELSALSMVQWKLALKQENSGINFLRKDLCIIFIF